MKRAFVAVKAAPFVGITLSLLVLAATAQAATTVSGTKVGIGATSKLSALTVQPGTSFTISSCTTTANGTADIVGVGAGCQFTSNVSVGSRIALSSDLSEIGAVVKVVSDTELLLDDAYEGDSLGNGSSQTITVYPGAVLFSDENGVPVFVMDSAGRIGIGTNPAPFSNGAGTGPIADPTSQVFIQTTIPAGASSYDTLNLDGTTPINSNDYSSSFVTVIDAAATHEGSGTLGYATVMTASYGTDSSNTGTVTNATGINLQAYAGSSGTITNAYGVHIYGSGAGRIVNQYNFACDDINTTIMTFGTCLYSNVSAGTGKYNIYIPGTANSYIAGKVGIGTSTPATKLHISSGASATTTVTIGELGLSSSKACVNMNRADGGPGSFYISAAGAGVFEANYCR